MWIILAIAIGLALLALAAVTVVTVRAVAEINRLERARHPEDEVERAWRESDDRDGLGEVGIGFLSVMVGSLIFLLAPTAPPYLQPTSWAGGLLPALVGIITLVMQLAIEALRKRLSQETRRAIYSATNGRQVRIFSLFVGWMAALVVGTLVIIPLPPVLAPALQWLPLLQGLIVGGTLLRLWRRLHLGRFYALAVASTLIGAAVSVANPRDPFEGEAIYFGTLGAALIASGALVFWSFLRRVREEARH